MDMNINHYQEIKLSDFGLVAALLTLGYYAIRTEREGRRVLFIFDKTNELDATMRNYWAGILMVSALQYFETTKGLKSRIYSE